MNPYLSFVLGSILTLILGILANLSTPKTQSFIQRWSLTSKGKKITQVVKQYKGIKLLRDSHHYAMLTLLSRFAFGLFNLTFLITLIGVNIISPGMQKPTLLFLTIEWLIFILLGCWTLWQWIAIAVDITRIIYIDGYERAVKAQIQKLGGNAEELLKEITPNPNP